jgi:mono/diheme cytochrome c family protein
VRFRVEAVAELNPPIELLQVNRAALLVAALTLPSAIHAQNGSAERPVSGSFSADQAARGEQVFRASCAACHEPTFHTGEQFMFSWKGRTLADYFKTVKTTMPEDNPAGLPNDDYVRVIAYIMKLNGYAPGSDSLSSDTLHLKRIRIGESREPQRTGSP